LRKMLKNMRVFIAYCVFFNPGREMATGFTNITGITSRTSKLRTSITTLWKQFLPEKYLI